MKPAPPVTSILFWRCIVDPTWFQATALRVKTLFTRWTKLNARLDAAVRRDDVFLGQHSRYVPTHDLQQHTHTTGAVQPFQSSDHIAEHSCHDTHGFTRTHIRPPLYDRHIVTGLQKCLYDSDRYRRRTFALHHQSRNAVGTVHAAPAIAREIKRNEKVTGEERDQYGFGLARVAADLSPARQEHFKILVDQMRRSAGFPMCQALHRIPTGIIAWR